MNYSLDRPQSDFVFNDDFDVTEHVLQAFDRNGYIILRGLLDSEEVDKLQTALEHDDGVMTKFFGRDDGAGRKAKTALWCHPGNDITGVIARSEKFAGTFEKLLKGEVYHYHSKVIMKEAQTGGQHVWHQDYGYWYKNGCMFPDMGTVWVAVDKATKENGCVQILAGSHLLGRIDHGKVGEQVGANIDRVEQAKKFCDLLFCELNPGDGLFFHSNILHRSDQNSSDKRRWAFLVAYNRADNDPVSQHHLPNYTKLHKVANSAIKECTTDTDMSRKDFFLGDISIHKSPSDCPETLKQDLA